MGKRPKRKVILFLVEGPTDREALSSAFSKLYKKYRNEDGYIIEFCTLVDDVQENGDITSKFGVTVDNIEAMISKLFVDPFLDSNPYYYPKDIAEIIQIVDLDGAYILPDKVVPLQPEHSSYENFYSESYIETVDVAGIRERNERKSANLDAISQKTEIIIRRKNNRNTKTVPYSVYFFSSNMDHLIHGLLNISGTEKWKKASDFMLMCDEDDSAFEKFFCDCKFNSCGRDYNASWEYVKEDCRSLECGTNLDILIKKIVAGNIDEAGIETG